MMRFQFLDATNLSSPDAGRMDAVAIEFIDKDHIRQHWTWRAEGKATTDAFEFARKR
jgi:hypothetical protein